MRTTRLTLRAGAAFLLMLALPFFFHAPHLSAQTSPVTVTPTLVTINLNQPLYCAASFSSTAHTVQLYCYTTVARTWDTLVDNQIFSMTQASIVDHWYTLRSLPNPWVRWFIRYDPSTQKVNWNVLYSADVSKPHSGSGGNF